MTLPVPPELTITMVDVTTAGFCARKARGWFRDQGLYEEFRTLTKGGTMPASKLLATGDPRALQVVQRKLEREAADG